jgi:hypothetical protein
MIELPTPFPEMIANIALSTNELPVIEGMR